MALPDLLSAVSAELFVTHWQHSNRTFATRKNSRSIFFCLLTQFAQIKTVKILRKIKASLQRNKKSRSKQKQAQQQQAEQQSQHQRPSSSCCCSQQGDNCEKNCSTMESNLNRMINQSLRHPLSGQLSKYTNVMKGEVKEKL